MLLVWWASKQTSESNDLSHDTGCLSIKENSKKTKRKVPTNNKLQSRAGDTRRTDETTNYIFKKTMVVLKRTDCFCI